MGPALMLLALAILLLALAFALIRFAIPAFRAAAVREAARTDALPANEAELAGDDDAARFSAVGTVALTDVADAPVLLDPSVSGERILFAAGTSADNLDRLVRYDTVTGEAEGVLVPMRYDTLRNPVEDDARIVYVDAKKDGGGAIRAFDKATGETSLVCEIASDIPLLFYDTPYLVWKERTAAGITKLYACHLATGDSVTLSVLAPGLPAQSQPSLFAGEARYVATDPANGAHGVIRSVRLADGEVADYAPGTYARDPKRQGGVLAWTSGCCGDDNDLYCAVNGGAKRKIAAGVVDFGIAGDVVAYGLNGTVYAYVCGSDETIPLSVAGEYAQFAAAGGGVIVWRNLANPAQPVWKYRRID